MMEDMCNFNDMCMEFIWMFCYDVDPYKNIKTSDNTRRPIIPSTTLVLSMAPEAVCINVIPWRNTV